MINFFNRKKTSTLFITVFSIVILLLGINILCYAAEEPIKIAVIEDQSGDFAMYGIPKVHAAQLAAAEFNEAGGILGRKIELLTPDPQSNPTRYQELVNWAILDQKVDMIIATAASAHRESIRPIIDKYKQLYFYTNIYEGGLADKYTFLTGAVPEQQMISAVKYMVENFGPKIYIIAVDYIGGHNTAKWGKVTAPMFGGEIIGEEYIPVGVSEFADVIARIQKAEPDWIMTFLSGENQLNFYPQSNAANLHTPKMSIFNLAQGYEHLRFAPPALNNMYAAVNYMQEIPTERNKAFVERWHKMFPDEPYISELGEGTYIAMNLYKIAVELAGTVDQAEVRKALESGITYKAPRGDVFLDPATHHLTNPIWVVKCNEKHEIEFIGNLPAAEPWWLRRLGVNLVRYPEFKQYMPEEDPYFEWLLERK
jgi:branched-chain amino acid transport system substrate-binding protein